MKFAMIERLALVGRAEELAYLQSAAAERHGAVIGGAPGVGKTRLAREVAASLPQWHVAWSAATPSTADLPLGGVAGLGLGAGALDSPGTGALFFALTAELVERAAGRPVLVVVDDAHLLDELSSGFVHHLAVSSPVSVLLTVRTGEQPPPTIVRLYKDVVLSRLELQPLGMHEFAELAATMLGGPLHGSTVDALWRSTDGNVLFLRELIADAEDAGTLTVERGAWRWHPGNPVGPRLGELVAERMGRLDGPRRHFAELLAVGEPLCPGTLDHVAPDVDLAQEERGGLIVVEEDRRRLTVRLAHPLFAEAIRARLGVAARRDVLGRLADALEATGARRHGDLLRLAIWRLESGTTSDSETLAVAAEIARREFDPALALRLARASVELEANTKAEVVLGGALGELGQFAAALEVFEEVDTSTLDDITLQRMTRDRAWATLHGPEGFAGVRRTLADAEGATSDPLVRCLARGDLCAALAYDARFAEATEVGEPLMAPEMDERVRLRSLAGVGASLAMAGRLDRVLALCDDLEPVAIRRLQEFPQALGWVLAARTNAMVLGGRIATTIEWLTPLFAPGAPPVGRPSDHAYAQVKFAMALLLGGLAHRAIDQLEAAIGTLRTNDTNGCSVLCLSSMAEAHALLGDLELATELAEEAVRRRDTGFVPFDGEAARARAWVPALAGETSRAVSELLSAADELEARGQQALALHALHDALRIGAPVGAQVEDMAAVVDGTFAAAAALHGAGTRRQDPELLARAIDVFAAEGMSLHAAEAATDTAQVLRASGRTGQAAAMSRRGAVALADTELGALPLPRHRVTTSLPSPLTRRELEVATLAASGLANGEIASSLVLSTRTVESHLHAAYRKLGTNDRSELAAVLSAEAHCRRRPGAEHDLHPG